MVENGSFRNRAAACGAVAAAGAEVRACSPIHNMGHLSGGERPGRGSAPTFLILENIMKRRIFSFLLAVVMVFSLAPSVFAAEGDSPVVVMTADKTSVKPGENVTITYSLDHDLPEMTRLNIVLCYDHTLFDFVSSNIDDSVWFTSPKVNEVIDLGESGAKGFKIKQNKNSNTATIPAGKLCSITFVALQPDSSVSATFCNYDSAFGSSIRYDGETYGAYKGGIFDHCSDDPIKVSIIPAGSSITVPKPITRP